MDWPSHINARFDSIINNKQIPEEFKRSLRTHPTARKFRETLASEISKAERAVAKRRGKELKLDTINSTIDDLINFWIIGLEREADKRKESYLMKQKRESELQYQKDLEATVDGTPTGEFEGLDIEYGDTEEESYKGEKA